MFSDLVDTVQRKILLIMSITTYDDVIKWKHFRVTGPLCREFIGHQWYPLTGAFDAPFALRLNKRLSEQSGRRWLETPLWRRCNSFTDHPQTCRAPFTDTGLTTKIINYIHCKAWHKITYLFRNIFPTYNGRNNSTGATSRCRNG